MKKLLLLVLSLVACLSLLLSGCGGGGNERSEPGSGSGSARTASATFTIVWPEPSRLIPIASRAIQVDVLQGSTKVGSKTAARGAAGSTTTITIGNIPAGNLTFTATALPNVNTSGTVTTGSGVPQATGTAPIKTEAGKTAKVTLTMATTIVRLAIFPNPWQIQKLTPTVPARATAYDAQNRVVMTDVDEQFTWTSANTDIITISPASGAIEGLTVGTTTITVKDKESGKTATSTVQVVEALPVDRVLLSPATLNLEPKATGMLTAQALDDEDKDLEYTADKFAWTSSDPTKATVDATGKVTAVANGTTTIEAKEKVTGKSATAIVTVASVGRGDLIFRFAPTPSTTDLGRPTSTTTYERLPSAVNALAGNPRTTFSRDGRRAFFDFFQIEGSTTRIGIKTINADGSGERVIYTEPVPAGSTSPQYSFLPNPSGTKVLALFFFQVGGVYTQKLVEINVQDATSMQLPLPSGFQPYILKGYSPDTSRYAVEGFLNGTTIHHWLVERDGTVVRELPEPAPRDRGNFFFNASGTRMVFVEAGASSDDRRIGLLDGEGNRLASQISAGYVEKVAIHPDGEKLLFRETIFGSTIRSRIYEINLDGTGRRLIYEGEGSQEFRSFTTPFLDY